MNHCHLCEDFFVPSRTLLLHHIARVHSNMPDFNMTCGLDECMATFKNYHAFKRHLRKKCSVICNLEDEEAEVPTTDDYNQENSPSSNPTYSSTGGENEGDRERSVALWILKLKESQNLTQSVTEEILGDVTELCSNMASSLEADLRKIMSAARINPDDISGLKELFHGDSPYHKPFNKLNTQYLQMSYYKSHFNFVVS